MCAASPEVFVGGRQHFYGLAVLVVVQRRVTRWVVTGL